MKYGFKYHPTYESAEAAAREQLYAMWEKPAEMQPFDSRNFIASARWYDFGEEKGWLPAVCARHVIVKKARKSSERHECLGYVYGTCKTDADSQVEFLPDGIIVLDAKAWHDLQVSTHLKLVGIKSKR